MSVAYLNGKRIFFDTRHPYVDPADWWTAPPPAVGKPSQQHAVSSKSAENRGGAASCAIKREKGISSTKGPFPKQAPGGEATWDVLNGNPCSSSIYIRPSSIRRSTFTSFCSLGGDGKTHEAGELHEREKKKKEENSVVRGGGEQEDKMPFLHWGRPLFLVDYTTLWWNRVSPRYRWNCTPPSPSVDLVGHSIEATGDPPLQQRGVVYRNAVHLDSSRHPSCCYLSSSDSSFRHPTTEGDDVSVRRSPSRQHVPSFSASSWSSACGSSFNPPSSSPFYQEGVVHDNSEARERESNKETEEDSQEAEAFEGLEKALHRGSTTLSPFPVVLLLPTTAVLGSLPPPTRPPVETKSDARTPKKMQEGGRDILSSLYSPPSKEFAFPPMETMEEERSEKDGKGHRLWKSARPPSPALSTPASRSGAGGSSTTEDEAGKGMHRVTSKVCFQPYHHYHTVAFYPESLPLVAGEWNAADCFNILDKKYVPSPSSPSGYRCYSSNVTSSSCEEKMWNKTYPGFMYNRGPARPSSSVSHPSATITATPHSRDEGEKDMVHTSNGCGPYHDNHEGIEEKHNPVEMPRWAQEEQVAFSMLKKHFFSSAIHKEETFSMVVEEKEVDHPEKGSPNGNDKGGRREGWRMLLEPQPLVPQASSWCREKSLAEEYYALPVKARAYLHSCFAWPRRVSTSSSFPSRSVQHNKSVSLAPECKDGLQYSKDHANTEQQQQSAAGMMKRVVVEESEVHTLSPVSCTSSERKRSREKETSTLEKREWEEGSTTSRGSGGVIVKPKNNKSEKILAASRFCPQRIRLKPETMEFLQELRK